MYPSGLESESESEFESGNVNKPSEESQGKSVTFGMIKVCVSCVQVHLLVEHVVIVYPPMPLSEASVVCDVSL